LSIIQTDVVGHSVFFARYGQNECLFVCELNNAHANRRVFWAVVLLRSLLPSVLEHRYFSNTYNSQGSVAITRLNVARSLQQMYHWVYRLNNFGNLSSEFCEVTSKNTVVIFWLTVYIYINLCSPSRQQNNQT